MCLTGFWRNILFDFDSDTWISPSHLLDTDSFHYISLLHQRIFWYLLCRLGKSSESLEACSSFSKLLSSLKQDLNPRVHGSQDCDRGSENRNEFKKESSKTNQAIGSWEARDREESRMTDVCPWVTGRKMAEHRQVGPGEWGSKI